MPTINPIITDAGLAAAISANGNGLQLAITHVALGIGQYTPTNGQTAMTGRKERASISAGAVTSVGGFRIGVLFPAWAGTPNPYNATEIGFYAGDPDAGGILFAVYSHPSSIIVQRNAIDYVTSFGMQLSRVPSGSVTVTVDPAGAQSLALIAAHEQALDPHPQYAREAILALPNGANIIGFTHDRSGSYGRTLHAKATDILCLYDKGAGGSVAQNTQAVADAIAHAEVEGRDHIFGAGQTLEVSSIVNPRGIRFLGGTKLVKTASQTGTYQLNSYADDGKYFIGTEYLYRLRLRLGLGGLLKCFFFSDSTGATLANGGGYAGTEYEPQNLIPKLMSLKKKIRTKVSIVNRGIGGTRVSQMNAMPDLDTVGGTTDVFFIKYGINDAQEGLSGFAASLRAKLTEIRANGYGTVQNLSIVLIGPNATHDPEHGRSSAWYESIRGIYVNAAREFDCFYFDTYAYLRDVEWAAGYMMDNPFNNGQGVHPTAIMQNMIYGGLIDVMFSESSTLPYSSNAQFQVSTTQNLGVNTVGAVVRAYGNGGPITLTLPDASPLIGGFPLTIVNSSNYPVTVIAASGNYLINKSGASTSPLVVLPGDDLVVDCVSSSQWWATGGSATLLTSKSFDSLLGSNGFKKIPDPNSPTGFILDQWGNSISGAGGGANITFPIAFSSGPYSVVVSTTGSVSAANSVYVWGVGGQTAAGFSAWCTQGSSGAAAPGTGFNWRAIGG